jgi:hypothetical protein
MAAGAQAGASDCILIGDEEWNVEDRQQIRWNNAANRKARRTHPFLPAAIGQPARQL